MKLNNIITVKVTDEQIEELKNLSKKMYLRKSDVIRMAVQEFIERSKNKKGK